MTDASRDVGDLLARWSGGDPDARDAAIRRVYEELRRIARNRLRREGDLVALETTELVHEAYLRLAAQNRTQWQNRAHFFAIAARTMRRILVDHARARHA